MIITETVSKYADYFLMLLFASPAPQPAPISKAKSLAFEIGPVKILYRS